MKALKIFLLTTTIFSTLFIEISNAESCMHGFTKPHENDCQQYYSCISSHWVIKSCPSNKYFSPSGYCIADKNVCNEHTKAPELSTKPFPTRPKTKWTPPETKPTTTKSTTIRTTTTTMRTTNLQCIENLKMFNGLDCTQYWECINGKWLNKNCDKGEYYNKENYNCEIDNGNCKPTTIITTKTTNSPVTSECKAGSFKKDPDFPSKYYICIKKHWKIFACPLNAHFDMNIKMCSSS